MAFNFWRKRDEGQNQSAPVNENENPSDVLLTALMRGDKITRAQALTIPSVASNTDFITNTIASMPVRLFKRVDGKVEEVLDDPRVQLLNADTGDTLDSFQFKKAMVEDYLLSSGGYAYIEKYMNEVTGLYYVENDYVVIDYNFKPIYKSYSIFVEDKRYKPFEFIKLLRNTKNGAWGEGIIEELNEALQRAYQTQLFALGLVKTGGNKKGFLKSERRLGREEIAALKTAWRNLYQNNTDNVVVLNNGIDFKEATNTSVEMQLNESINTLGEQINDIFHIKADFYETFKIAIYPIVKAFETALNRELLLELEKGIYFFEFDVKETIKANIKERYECYKLAKEIGFLTKNEMRAEENRNYIDGLDVIDFGLGSVLYDVNTKTYYTPNTNESNNLKTLEEESIIDHDNGSERAYVLARYNENHAENGQFAPGGGGGSSSSGKSGSSSSGKSEDKGSGKSEKSYEALTNEQADEVLGKELDNVLAQDNDYHDMRDSLINYTYGGHDAENKILRGQDLGDEYDADDVEMFREEIGNIENAIDLFDTPQNITVYRKTNGDFSNLNVGDTFQDNGFVSTSTSRDFVDSFTGSTNELGDSAYTLEINVASGKGRGAFIRGISDYPDEYEFLLQRGTQFTVDDIDHNARTMRVTISGNERGDY